MIYHMFLTFKNRLKTELELATCNCFGSTFACRLTRRSCYKFSKPPIAIATAALCTGPVHLFVCLFVCLSVCLSPNCNNAIFSKTKPFRAMVSIDEVVHGLFREPIIGLLKSKTAEIRHLENRHAVMFLPWVV